MRAWVFSFSLSVCLCVCVCVSLEFCYEGDGLFDLLAARVCRSLTLPINAHLGAGIFALTSYEKEKKMLSFWMPDRGQKATML